MYLLNADYGKKPRDKRPPHLELTVKWRETEGYREEMDEIVSPMEPQCSKERKHRVQALKGGSWGCVWDVKSGGQWASLSQWCGECRVTQGDVQAQLSKA